MATFQLCLAFFMVAWTTSFAAWQTKYKDDFRIECPANKVISRLRSHHDNGPEDRVWEIDCKDAPGNVQLENCEWTGYANGYRQNTRYHCPRDAVIVGMRASTWNDNDRMFGFKCCDIADHVLHSCTYAGNAFRNSYDLDLDYEVPNGFVIQGVESQFNAGRKDRRFGFDFCKLGQIEVLQEG